jgi:hypothetical protein
MLKNSIKNIMENLNIINSYSDATALQMFEVAKEGIVNGDLEPLKVLHYLKKFSDAFELLKKDSQVLAVASNEIAKYGKECVVSGRKFKIQSMVLFDFKNSNDPYLFKLESELKKRKELLRNISSPFFDEHGEGLEIAPLKKRVVTYIVMNDL